MKQSQLKTDRRKVLSIEIARIQKNAAKQPVLLVTLPSEEHTLGLLMVVGLLSSEGIATINLGGEAPMDRIIRAVKQFHADTVGITFSGAYQYNNIRTHLLGLRELIPDAVGIWICHP